MSEVIVGNCSREYSSPAGERRFLFLFLVSQRHTGVHHFFCSSVARSLCAVHRPTYVKVNYLNIIGNSAWACVLDD